MMAQVKIDLAIIQAPNLVNFLSEKNTMLWVILFEKQIINVKNVTVLGDLTVLMDFELLPSHVLLYTAEQYNSWKIYASLGCNKKQHKYGNNLLTILPQLPVHGQVPRYCVVQVPMCHGRYHEMISGKRSMHFRPNQLRYLYFTSTTQTLRNICLSKQGEIY